MTEHECKHGQVNKDVFLYENNLPDDMPCPKCGGQWDCVAVQGNRNVVVCGDCDAVIPEDEYIQANRVLAKARVEVDT